MDRKREIAEGLLSIGAVFLRPEEPFTWASGIKSPIYCDNRLTLTAPEVRIKVEEGLKAVIEENYPDVEVLMGTSTAGIAHAATAGSSIETVKVLREAGADVLGIASIFTYGMKKGLDRMAEAEVKNVSLCDLDALVEAAAETGYIRAEDRERILKFRDNPSDESWMNK